MHYKNTQYLKLFRTFLGILVGLSFVTIRQSEAAVSNPSEAAFLAACGIKTPPSSSPIKEDGDVSERWKWRDEQASHRSYMSWAFDADSSANRNPRYLNPRCEELILSRIADQKGADHDYVFDRCERVRDKIYHFTRRGGGRRDGGSLRNDFLRRHEDDSSACDVALEEDDFACRYLELKKQMRGRNELGTAAENVLDFCVNEVGADMRPRMMGRSSTRSIASARGGRRSLAEDYRGRRIHDACFPSHGGVTVIDQTKKWWEVAIHGVSAFASNWVLGNFMHDIAKREQGYQNQYETYLQKHGIPYARLPGGGASGIGGFGGAYGGALAGFGGAGMNGLVAQGACSTPPYLPGRAGCVGGPHGTWGGEPYYRGGHGPGGRFRGDIHGRHPHDPWGRNGDFGRAPFLSRGQSYSDLLRREESRLREQQRMAERRRNDLDRRLQDMRGRMTRVRQSEADLRGLREREARLRAESQAAYAKYRRELDGLGPIGHGGPRRRPGSQRFPGGGGYCPTCGADYGSGRYRSGGYQGQTYCIVNPCQDSVHGTYGAGGYGVPVYSGSGSGYGVGANISFGYRSNI